MRKLTIFLSLLALALTFGCGGDAPAEQAAGDAAQPLPPAERNARTLPIPGEGENALPPGHPDVGISGGLVWKTPAGWVEVPPSNSMRRFEYRVPGPGGDGLCYVAYFGTGQGGDPMANALRWADQFEQPDGSPSSEKLTTRQLDGTGFPTLVAEVTGTFGGGMVMSPDPPPPQENYMLLGAVVEGPDAPWFFKFIGPEATVRDQSDAFDEMLRSIGLGS